MMIFFLLVDERVTAQIQGTEDNSSGGTAMYTKSILTK